MVQIIVFSFNRAMQLDYLLISIFARFKSPEYKIAIIYHTSGDHDLGYKKLIEKYKNIDNILFLERKYQKVGLLSYYATFHDKKNIKRFIKYNLLHYKKIDNFKKLLESVLKSTVCEYVLFNTDDGYFFDDVNITPNILNLIKSNSLNTSYRLYVGENIEEFPKYLQRVNDDFYTWDYYEHAKFSHWTFPFAVDGTVYHTKSILSILRKVYYYSPLTLENHTVEYVIKNKLLKRGLSPITSKLIGTLLNNVSLESSNPTININTDYLNNKFLDGFELELTLEKEIKKVNNVPIKVTLKRDEMEQTIYEIEEKGKNVHDSYGIGGQH